MIKKMICTGILSTLILTVINAQVTYGIRAGVSIAKWQGEDLKIAEDLIDKTDGDLVTKGTAGFHAGVYVNIPFSEAFSFEPGFQYSKKGYRIKGDFQIPALKYFGVNVGAQVQSHYIDIPLLLKAKLVKGLYVHAGPQVSFLIRNSLNAKVGVLGISLFNKGIGITERFNRVDLGLTGGIGYQFDNGVNIQAGYDQGLSTLDKNDNFNAYNRVVKISVGIGF